MPALKWTHVEEHRRDYYEQMLENLTTSYPDIDEKTVHLDVEGNVQ